MFKDEIPKIIFFRIQEDTNDFPRVPIKRSAGDVADGEPSIKQQVSLL